jgi:hypothetical protein
MAEADACSSNLEWLLRAPIAVIIGLLPISRYQPFARAVSESKSQVLTISNRSIEVRSSPGASATACLRWRF